MSVLPALLAGVLALSCHPSQIEVVDRSFSISATVSRDSGEHVLVLQLDRGGQDAAYEVTYSIDGEYVPVLMEQGGTPVANRFTLSFRRSPAVRYVISSLHSGDHVLSLDISTENHSMHVDCPFMIDIDRFSVHAEVNTSSSVSSVVLVSLTGGRTDRPYDILVSSLEGAVLSEMKGVDFSVAPIASVALPLLRPSIYEVAVDVSDGTSSQDVDLEFREPVRHPKVGASLRYDEQSGDIVLSVDDNPYGLWMSADVEATVNGSCTVNLSSGYFHGGPNQKSFTTSLTERYGKEAFIPEKGRAVVLCSLADLDRRMTQESRQSYVWVEGYDSQMEEYGTWCLNFTVPEYFHVTGHTAEVRVNFESLEGVDVILRSQNVDWLRPSFVRSN